MRGNGGEMRRQIVIEKQNEGYRGEVRQRKLMRGW